MPDVPLFMQIQTQVTNSTAAGHHILHHMVRHCIYSRIFYPFSIPAVSISRTNRPAAKQMKPMIRDYTISCQSKNFPISASIEWAMLIVL